MDTDSLSRRQRRFAIAVAGGAEPLEAAAVAGYAAARRESWSARNMKDPLVRAMVVLLKERQIGDEGDATGLDDAATAAVTREDITRMLNADRKLAYAKGTPSAAVSASLAIARLNGLIVERRHDEARPLAEMSDDELARHLAALEREARAVLAIDLTVDVAGEPPDESAV